MHHVNLLFYPNHNKNTYKVAQYLTSLHLQRKKKNIIIEWFHQKNYGSDVNHVTKHMS